MKRLGCLALALGALFLAGACGKSKAIAPPSPLDRAYDVEPDWSDAQHLIPLNYTQAQGKRLFYTYCVWCHADSTPAGPSNRSNINPLPPLANDGATFNSMSDELLRNTITLGGSAMGKSGMMPAWGKTLTQKQVQELIAYLRAIAQPPYTPPARPGPQYNVR
jgi:cytochrome c5